MNVLVPFVIAVGFTASAFAAEPILEKQNLFTAHLCMARFNLEWLTDEEDGL